MNPNAKPAPCGHVWTWLDTKAVVDEQWHRRHPHCAGYVRIMHRVRYRCSKCQRLKYRYDRRGE